MGVRQKHLRGTTQLVGNTKILQSSYGPEDLYLAHGRGDGFAPQLWSLSEHAQFLLRGMQAGAVQLHHE
ncbi:hypothetical protein [Streptomyces sp. NPDC006415]|uniref:hypothetical protein n=1 Tax=Streptomyces sp. NPDC006415 TaxID=3155351 RepID=UPI0033A8F2B3